MKKSTGVIGVVVLVAAAYVGTSWYVGKEAQATVEHIVAQANERLVKVLGADLGGSGLNIEIKEYNRQFFSSDISYSIHMQGDDGKPVELKMHDHLQHGPFPLGALRKGDFSPMLAYSQASLVASPATQTWFDSQAGKAPVHGETRVGFFGKGKSVWTFEPTNLVEDNETLAFSGGVIEIAFSNDFNDHTATGDFAELSLMDDDTGDDLKIRNVRINSKTATGQQDDIAVATTATVDAVVIDGKSDDALVIENMTINLDSLQKASLLDGSLRYDFGRIAVGNAELGSVSIGVKAEHLDMAAITAMAVEYDAIRASHGVEENQDFELTDAEEAVMRDRIMAILASNPVLSIDPLVWKNKKGQSQAGLKVNLAKPANPDVADNQVLVAEIFKRIQLDLSLSKSMFIQVFGQAEKVPEQRLQMELLGALLYDQYIARLKQAGLVRVEGDTASLDVLYENNSVNVNGQTMPVDEFLQRAMSVGM
ncbi:MAG TPA: YdgA family protein [Candidimonas sp.]|nr:YdgA family protein [Candidimonas sp.]